MGRPNKRQIHIKKLAQDKRRSSDPTYVDNVSDIEMDEVENFTIVHETSTKSRTSFYSVRTQQRHAKVLRDAAIGSAKITDFFNVKASSGNQLESNDDLEDDWKNAIKSVEQALENPNLANNVKSRLIAIEMYFRHLDDGRKKVDASELVAISLGWAKTYKGRCIRSWAKQWIQNRTLPESKRGKHPKMKSLWNHEDVAAQIRSYARSNKVDMTPKKLCEH
ncbi:11451_t:CDS:2, partial [Entrophospora sp. SA101]